ncbi:DUF3037 domain-containing protein [Cytobacillus firmus]|uniref:DUF3037 domain-containing protein n=1 Tax=Cytobacillus firmus DS1 TaxID=1307436 RepID=W7KWC4_CYTFI|nr:DUF3037 domain-containing protein [Cytobacillus firmus]EWG11695.1 hypothetical protein PBF_06171 [Cytobacillus firmus DS1]
MNSRTIFYSICKYVPDIIRGEFINVGILTYIPELGLSKFQKTRNLARVTAFDDELELDILKALLESLEVQFNNSSLPVNKENPTPDYIQNELVYFVNQLQFTDVKMLNSTNIEEDTKDLYDMYLYYDQKKSDRISAERVKRLVSKLFTANEFKNVNRKPSEQNIFRQRPFDFSLTLDGESALIKALTFDYKNQNKLYNEIKSFLFDLNYFKEMGIDNIKVVINNTDMDNDFEKLAYKLLSKEVEVLTVQQFAEYLNGAEKQHLEQLSLFN